MMKRNVTLLLPFCAVALSAQPRFVPDTEVMKLGEVEFNQPKRFTIGFANKGDQPLEILSVHPSCGCVTASYTTTSVNSGGRGEVTITFDARMLGGFHREIELMTNASDTPYYLAVEGTVVKEVQDCSEDFPIDLGNVRLQTNCVEFDDVNMGDKPVGEIRFVNMERTAYRPELMHLPPYLSARYEPENVPAGKVGKIFLTLDSEKLMRMGLTQTSVYLARYLGDKVSETNEIIVSAVLLPDFSQLTEAQLASAPESFMPETSLDFGQMGNKKKLSKTLMLLNKGKSDLHIQHVQVFNKAVAVSVGSKTVKPGKSTKIKVTVFAEYLKKTKFRPRVLLITDDPKHTKQTVNIEVKP